MARSVIQAAGGIVFRSGTQPLIAIVRLRKDDDWVLPKGKLNAGETHKAAAKREVFEETGFEVTVHEFLGKLKYRVGGRVKVVHFWRMEAFLKVGQPLDDVRDLDWLPLPVALKRLTRSHEREFLAENGPLAEKVRKQSNVHIDNARSRRSANNPTTSERSKSRLKAGDPAFVKRTAGHEGKLRRSDRKHQGETQQTLWKFLLLFWKRFLGAG